MTPEQVKWWANHPCAIYIDGTHIRICRPTNKDWRKLTSSGKKKTNTVNTTIVTDSNNLIINIGETREGSIHDMKLLTEHMFDLGEITEILTTPDLPDDQKIPIFVDKGYAGIEKLFPGAIVFRPFKRKRNSDKKTGGLTQEQRDYNHEVNSNRVGVEHAIGGMKRFNILNKPRSGLLEDYNDELDIVSGLANLRTIMRGHVHTVEYDPPGPLGRYPPR